MTLPGMPTERVTIDKVDITKPMAEWKPLVADSGRRRHVSLGRDFDSRAHSFDERGEGWSEEIRALHLQNRGLAKERFAQEFGSDQLERKVEDFVAMGIKRMSILAYHNAFFDQARRSFVIGAYYPALVGACALAERILNHLVLDLREFYKHKPEYKRVYRKQSFDDWRIPIDTLETWGVLLPTAVVELRKLKMLRDRSIHFNVSTYSTLRQDALAAIKHVGEIIDQQFTAFGNRPWFIKGTRGHVFIKKEWEETPIIKTYYLPNCQFVGPYFSMSLGNGGWIIHDHNDYGDGEWTDEDFSIQFETRKAEWVAKAD